MSTIPLLLLLFISYICCENPLSVDKTIGEGFGVNTHFTHPKEGEVKMIRDAGFKLIRQDFNWENTEKVKGVYNFNDYDYLVKQLEEHDVSAYFTFSYSNLLYEKHRSVVTEAGRKAYAKWTAAAVEHFKGKGFIWEIWNEPNLSHFWGNHANVTEYSMMALESVKAIREKAPNEIVVGPATLDLHFEEECLKAGLNQYWGAISIHPYRGSHPESVIINFKTQKEMIAKYEPKGKHLPVLSGEWGYSSAYKGFTEAKQAKYLQRQMLHNVLNDIPISIWYDWHDDGEDKTNAEHNFGIVNFAYKEGKSPVYEPKEAYTAAKTMNTILKGFKFVKRIATKDKDDYVLLFRNEKKELRLTVWKMAETAHEITIPSDKCDFDVIHNLGTPIQKASSNEGHLVLTIDDSVHFIVPKCTENKALENAPAEK